MCKNNIDAEKLLVKRRYRFLKHFLILFTLVLIISCLSVIIALVGAFHDGVHQYIECLHYFYQFLAPSLGFIIAEMIRRSSVNCDDPHLRPYSWKQLLNKVRNFK